VLKVSLELQKLSLRRELQRAHQELVVEPVAVSAQRAVSLPPAREGYESSVLDDEGLDNRQHIRVQLTLARNDRRTDEPLEEQVRELRKSQRNHEQSERGEGGRSRAYLFAWSQQQAQQRTLEQVVEREPVERNTSGCDGFSCGTVETSPGDEDLKVLLEDRSSGQDDP
jgi:hypothetical protein